MEQSDEEGNASGADEVARFKVRGGKAYALRGGKQFLLGPAEPAHREMADHLGRVDFEDQ